MRPHEMINKLVARFADMDESDLRDLHSDASGDYKERLAQAKSKQISNLERLKEIAAKVSDEKAPTPRKEAILTSQDQLILKCEHWMTRYGFAIAYILCIPLIRGYMNGEADGEEDGNADMEFLRMLAAYQKMKKS